MMFIPNQPHKNNISSSYQLDTDLISFSLKLNIIFFISPFDFNLFVPLVYWYGR